MIQMRLFYRTRGLFSTGIYYRDLCYVCHVKARKTIFCGSKSIPRMSVYCIAFYRHTNPFINLAFQLVRYFSEPSKNGKIAHLPEYGVVPLVPRVGVARLQ